jgi:hypothetical protein
MQGGRLHGHHPPYSGSRAVIVPTRERIRKQNPKPVLDMIDEFFASEVPVTENGISQRRSAFEIIFLQLFNKAMAGNTRALKVLTKYSDFAASRDSAGGMRIELIDD